MLHGFMIFKDNNIITTTDGFRHVMAGYKGQSYNNSSMVHGMTPPVASMANVIQAEIPAAGARITIGRNELAKMDIITCHQLYGVVANKTEWLCDIKTAN